MERSIKNCIVILIAIGIVGANVPKDIRPAKKEQSVLEENKPVVEETFEQEKKGIVLEEREYWNTVIAEVETVLHENGFYIFRVDTGIPYYNFHIENGIATEEGKYSPCGLERTECEEKFNKLKAEVHEVLDKYTMDIQKGLFKKPNRYILGFHLDNRFVDEFVDHIEANRYSVASYQIDLISYYTDGYYFYDDGDFVKMNNFHSEMWERRAAYKPQEVL